MPAFRGKPQISSIKDDSLTRPTQNTDSLNSPFLILKAKIIKWRGSFINRPCNRVYVRGGEGRGCKGVNKPRAGPTTLYLLITHGILNVNIADTSHFGTHSFLHKRIPAY